MGIVRARDDSCNNAHEGCRILYRDIGDYLRREEKLAILREAGSIAGVEDWLEIAPDRHHDWIGQRDEAFQALYPMGSKAVKAGKGDETIFKLYSNGYKTGRDAYVYNFSRDACATNARAMVGDYLGALRELKKGKNPSSAVDDILRRYSSSFRWDRELKRRVRQQVSTKFSNENIRRVAYRPFVKQHLYADYTFSQASGQTRDIFPTPDSKNRAICVPGVGSTKPFSVLVVDTMPDLELISKGQCFPRYRYREPDNAQGALPGITPELVCIDNITDIALRAFRVRYNDNTITKDTIFDYVYGVLHASDYRERFADDLAKGLPRVPLAAEFDAFAAAGRELAALHLGYETGEEYPLEIAFGLDGEPRPDHFRIGERAMRFDDDAKTVLCINEHVTLRGISPQAHMYQVNGRTPLEWFIDRYRITRDKESGLVNDPNDWFDDPRELIAAIHRIVHVSVETVRIVATLPRIAPC